MTVAPSASPWSSIWLNPRETVRRLLAANPTQGLLALCGLLGMNLLYPLAHVQRLADNTPLQSVLLLSLLLSPIIGGLVISIGSLALARIGQLFGGVGTVDRLRCAVAWASAPMGLIVPLWWTVIAKFGSDVFSHQHPNLDSDPQSIAFIQILEPVAAGLIVWSLVSLINTVAEAHQFSVLQSLKTLAVALVPILAIVLPLVD